MSSAAEYAVEVESAFLAGVEANLRNANSRLFPGRFLKRVEHDRGERVRAAMSDRRMFDRERARSRMPQGRGFTLTAIERRWIFGRRVRSVTTASVLAPPEPLLDRDGPAPPVSLRELLTHVRSLAVPTHAPQVIGICSPSGFAEECFTADPGLPNTALVLVEPRSGGSWKVTPTRRPLDERLIQLFDPEDVGHKLQRVRREIDERRSDLLSGSLSAEAIAAKLGVSPRLVQTTFEQAAAADPTLRVARREGNVLLFRGAGVSSAKEDHSMSLAEWIRSLFSSSGDEAKKIDVLAERRAELSARLDRIYEDIGKLERKEAQLLSEGKAASSQVVKRRIAAQIAHLRKDIARTNTTAALLSKQINIISTHIHNLELAQTGNDANLPTSEELTQAAVNAEEILEQLRASDELVTGLDVGIAEVAVSTEEQEILNELEGRTPSAASPSAVGSADAAGPAPAARQKEHGPPQAEG